MLPHLHTPCLPADMNLRSALLHLSRTSKPPFSSSLPSQVVLWCAGVAVASGCAGVLLAPEALKAPAVTVQGALVAHAAGPSHLIHDPPAPRRSTCCLHGRRSTGPGESRFVARCVLVPRPYGPS